MPELKPTPHPALAVLEIASLAQGYAVADALVKAAAVELLAIDPVTPGKLLIIYAGGVAELEIAHAAGLREAGEDLIDQLLLPRVHPAVPAALWGRVAWRVEEALGLLETATVAAGLLAADAAVKAAAVDLLDIHAARGIGGRCLIHLTGAVADTEAALEAGAARAVEKRALLRRVLIPAAHPDLTAALRRRTEARS